MILCYNFYHIFDNCCSVELILSKSNFWFDQFVALDCVYYKPVTKKACSKLYNLT